MTNFAAKLQALRGNSIIRYGLTNFLPRSVAILTTLLVTPLAIKHLGVLDYGLWALATLIPNLISSPDFGITYGIVNVMTEAHQREGSLRSQRERLLGLARLLSLIAAGWFLLGALGLAMYVFGSGQTGGLPPERMYSALLLALGIFVLGISPSLWGRVQLAQERGHESVAWEGVGKVISFVASLLVLVLSPNLYLLIVASLLPNVITAFINAQRYICSELGPPQSNRWSLRQVIKANRAVFSAGKYFVAFQITYLIGSAIDPFLVNSLLGTKDVAYLTLARRPFDALPLAVTLFSTALWPVFNRLNSANHIEALRRLLARITLGSTVILMVLSTMIIVLAEPIYSYLSQGRLSVSRTDLLWIALQTLSTTIILVFNNYMSAVNLLRSQMWVQVIASVLGLTTKFAALHYGGLHAYFPASSVMYFCSALLPMVCQSLRHLQQRAR